MKSAYCEVRTGSLNKTVCASALKGYISAVSDTIGMLRWKTVSSKHVFGYTVTIVLVCVLLILVIVSQDICAVRIQMLLKG